MPTLTDPARELADLCARVSGSSNIMGEDFLARKFDVEPWSREFYEIVFSIAERCYFLVDIVENLDMDEDIKTDTKQRIMGVRAAFDANSLRNGWSAHGVPQVTGVNFQALRGLSPLIRPHVSYPLLSDEERDELLADLDQFIQWLEEHQLREHDFVRQSIIVGAKQFRFRLKRIGWLGWGYSVEALRDVITAYFALERGLDPANPDPLAQHMLNKTGDLLRNVSEKVGMAKDLVEKTDWLLRFYGAVSLAAQGHQKIAGLLQHLT